MARKIFKRFGIRRDNNLGDLSNTTEALNNLLDTLVDSPTSTFISEDLNAIRGSFSLGFTNGQYKQIIGSAEFITNQNGLSRPFLPRITYQNKLDIFRLFAGEPRLFGGNGLTARYYNSTDVYVNSVGIFSGTAVKTDNFWEAGNFTYPEKITPELIDLGGGVEWEGSFIPTSSGNHIFTINSSACFTFEFETEGYTSGIGTYTEISRIGISSTFSGTGNSGNNTITLNSPANAIYVGVGQTVSGTGIQNGTTVNSVNRSSGAIVLSNNLTSSGARNVTFAKTIGQNTRINYTTYVLEQYRPYRIRFRYFIPQGIDATNVSRYINFTLTVPNIPTEIGLRYNFLYSLEDYDFSDLELGSFNQFINNSIPLGGGTLGSTLNTNDYVKVETDKKIDIKYQPKTSISQVIRSSVSGLIASGTKVLSLTGLDTTNIEIGNYVFGTGIPTGTRVSDILINNSVILDQNATSLGSGTYTFVEHRGFVKRITGTTSSGTVTVTSGDTTSLSKDMIVIGTGFQSYTKITTIPTNTSFTVSPSQTVGSTTLYVYLSKGLINNGLSAYCLPAATQCVIATSFIPAGSTTLTVNDSSGIGNGWVVQGFQFAPGTTVTGIPNSTTINISTGTILSLNADSNFTVTNAGGDRTVCCPPIDVSPPFNSTLNGLDTVSGAPSLRIESGNLIFDSLVGIVSESNITQYSITDISGSRVSIQTPSGLFKILCA